MPYKNLEDRKRYLKRYNKINKDKLQEKYHKKYIKNREKILIQCKEWYRKNKKKKLSYDVEYRKKNIKRVRRYKRNWARKDSLKHPVLYSRARHLKSKYGMTEKDYNKLWDKQKGLCALCFLPLIDQRNSCIDHNHKTSKVRGILHQRCNLILGVIENNMQDIQLFINYLRDKDGKENIT
jgi:hypothetical protein